MLLMHENKRVASFTIFEDKPFNIKEIYDEKELPVGLQKDINSINRDLMRWHSSRTIPRGRVNIDKIQSVLGNTDKLSINSLGLSLTDHYWYKAENADVKWEDVNFFDNDFSPDLFLLENNLLDGQHLSPDYTTNGVLKKCWVISENEPFLIKAGGFNENDKILAANEVCAYKIASLFGFNATPYKQVTINNKYYCACPLFLDGKTEEFVSFRHIEMQLNALDNNSFVRNYIKSLGFSDYLDNLAFFNILIHNNDCHFDNAGLIRDAKTKEYTKPCKFFDNGSSLNWNNSKFLNNMRPFEASVLDYANTINTVYETPPISDLFYIIKEVYNDFEIPNKQIQIASDMLQKGYDILRQRIIKYEDATINSPNIEL